MTSGKINSAWEDLRKKKQKNTFIDQKHAPLKASIPPAHRFSCSGSQVLRPIRAVSWVEAEFHCGRVASPLQEQHRETNNRWPGWESNPRDTAGAAPHTRLYNQYKIHRKNKRSIWKQAARFAVLLNCKQQVEHRKCFPPEEAARRALTVVHETNTSFLSHFCIPLRRKRSLQCFSELMAWACSFWKKKPFHTLTPSCLDAACFGSLSAAISKLICFFCSVWVLFTRRPRWLFLFSLLFWQINAKLTITQTLAANPWANCGIQLRLWRDIVGT